MNKSRTAVLGASLFFSGSVLADATHNPGSGAHWQAPAAAAKRVNPVSPTPGSVAQGRTLYMQHCARCHGLAAEGDGPDATTLAPKPTNLRAMAGQHSDGDFAWKIANGRGPMPAWRGSLSEQQIWDLVNYVQSLKSGDPHPLHDGEGH